MSVFILTDAEVVIHVQVRQNDIILETHKSTQPLWEGLETHNFYFLVQYKVLFQRILRKARIMRQIRASFKVIDLYDRLGSRINFDATK